MQLLNGAYTQYVNFKRHCSGHLFREANRSDLFEAPSDLRAPRKGCCPLFGPHNIGALRNVVDRLKQVDSFGGGRDDIVSALIKLGREAQRRR